MINGTLLAAVVTMATLGYVAVAGTGGAAPTTARTATVAQGDITALVSAGGNATSAMNLGVNFTDCTGPLTAISVKPGQVVSAGQPLATVDPTKAQTALNNAQAQLSAVQP
ncbi:MAG: biotin/lipoyl-binding protein, partial [Mycobacteriaceae bacterium]